MQWINFDVTDVARVRLAPTVGAFSEAVFAASVLEFGLGGLAFHHWREAVKQQAGTSPGRFADVVSSARRAASADRVQGSSPVDAVVTAGLRDEEPALPAPTLSAVRRMTVVAVEPFWRRIRLFLGVEQERQGRVLSSSGVEALLGSLHAQVTWTSPTLQVAGPRSGRIDLMGSGLVIVPSLFLVEGPIVFVDPVRVHSSPVLVYPASIDLMTAGQIWSKGEQDSPALKALIGRTRAGALQALSEGCSTSELGQRLGVSSAAASQHASVLREAGLITSQRYRNVKLHRLTALGTALLSLNS